MGYKKVHIGAATLMVDEDTGAVLAKLSGTITADLIELDVDAMVAGIAGAEPKTQKDLDDRLTAILAKFPAAAGELATQTTLAALLATMQGTGLPIPLALSDPASDAYTATLNPNPVARACTRLRVIVADSGVVISLDGGVTDSVAVPADYADDLAVAIPSGADIRVKRYTPGTAISGLIVEVR
jgi:hypothetical protein